jgi:serine/threonine protein kinase
MGNLCLKDNSKDLQDKSNIDLESQNNDILCKYRKDYEIYSGKFGKIYKYKNINTGNNVAIKFSQNDIYFQKELGALSKLKHSNIISMIEYSYSNSSDDLNFIVEDYASNGDLYDILKKSVISERLSKFIIECILNALIYAYRIHNISHRDIKLENILIMKDGNIKLADWGLSAFNIKKRKCKRICGTKLYMAPEILLKKEYDSTKSDVWSLGVVLFLLCCKSKPYEEFENAEDMIYDDMYQHILNQEWDNWWYEHKRLNYLVNLFSVDLCYLIEKLFNYDVCKRYSLEDIKKDSWLKKIDCDRNDILKLINKTKKKFKCNLSPIREMDYSEYADY